MNEPLDLLALIPKPAPPSDEVASVLAKFGDALITPVQMTMHIGYKQDVIDMIDTFWEPTFNRGWIYLSDEIVMEQLTNETGINAIGNFNKMLVTDFKVDEGIKWMKINRKHPLVQTYLVSIHSNPVNRDKSSFSNRKQFYACTGSMYKQLLLQAKTQKGVIMREYFSLVESLAQYQHEYIRVMNDRIMRKQFTEAQAMLAAKMAKQIAMTADTEAKLAEEKKAKDEALQLAAEKERLLREQEKKSAEEKAAALAAERAKQSKEEDENKQLLYDKDSYAYIAISEDQAPRRSFKLGSVKEDTDKALAKRLNGYKTGHDAQATHFYAKIVRTYNAPVFDYVIRKLLAHRKTHDEKSTELTRGPFYKLESLMDRLLFHYEKMHEIVLDDIRTMHTDLLDPKCDDPVPRIALQKQAKRSVDEIAKITDAERVKLMTEFIEDYMSDIRSEPWNLATGPRPLKSIWPACKDCLIDWLNPSNRSFKIKPFKNTIDLLMGFG